MDSSGEFYPFFRRLSTLILCNRLGHTVYQVRDSARGYGPMRGRRRRASFYDRTAYNNRWYRWLALVWALLAGGVLTLYLLQ